jgi:hypothetical protein
MKTCPYCNYSNTDDAKFCVCCGKTLSEEQKPRDTGDPFEEIAPDPIVENDTPFNQDALKKFYINIKICAFVLFGCGALMLLLGVLDKLFLDPTGNETITFVCAVAMLVLGVVYIFLYRKSTVNNKVVTKTSRQLYLFYEDGIRAVFSDMGVPSSESNITYAQISKVTRRKYFILVWFGSTVWLIDRNTFVKGGEEQLKYLLLRKCGEKVVRLN